jgi:hypothetical protein
VTKTKTDYSVVDDDTLRQLQETLCGEIIQELGLVVFRRALHKAIADLEELSQRTNERMTVPTAEAKQWEESELADQYRAKGERRGGGK